MSVKTKNNELLLPKEETIICDEGAPASGSGPVAVDEELKAKIIADAKEKAADFEKYVPKYKVLKFPLAEPKCRIFCFHNAGSSESVYSAKRTPFMDWALETQSVEVIAMDYPGRQMLLKDTLHTSLDTLCPLLLSVLYEKLADGVPYIIWGHSVGTWVSFELLMLARKIGLPMPKVAFFNAFTAPHIPQRRRPWQKSASLSDEEFQEEVKRWDDEHFKGPSSMVFRDDQWPMYGPMMRADFQLFDEQTFKHSDAPRFDFPIHSWHMEGEHFCTETMVKLWGDWTSDKFYFHKLPMGHLSSLYNDKFKKELFATMVSVLKTYVD